MVWEEKSKFGFQDGGYGSHFGFQLGMKIAIFHLHVNLLLHSKYQLNCPEICEKMLKTDFQDCGCGGHLGFPILMILAFFHPEFALLLQSKFRLKSTKDLSRDVEN